MHIDLINSLSQEERTCQSMLHMTSYENRMSETARSFLGADLGNRYHLSTPWSFNGDDPSVKISGFSSRALTAVHNLELAAIKAAENMFCAKHVDLRLVSGVHGTLSTIAAMTKPGDVVYSIAPDDGGHFATKQVAEALGRVSKYLSWDNENLNLNLDASSELFKSNAPSLVFLDHGTPLFNLPVAELRARLSSSAVLVYDASHTLGLIAGGQFQNPLEEGADILQGNTHKTFPGPQKAIVMFRDQNVGRKYSEAVSLGLVSSQHTHHCMALGITVLEMAEYGTQYAQAMLDNAQRLGECLREEGLGLVSHEGIFTTSHELLISEGWPDDYLAAVDRLFAAGISVNARIAFSRPVIRIGVQEITRRGMGAEQMPHIAKLFRLAITDPDSISHVRSCVTSLNSDFPSIIYSFDESIRGINLSTGSRNAHPH